MCTKLVLFTKDSYVFLVTISACSAVTEWKRFLPPDIEFREWRSVVFRRINKNLLLWTEFRQEVRNYSVTYWQRLNDHPNRIFLLHSTNWNRRLNTLRTGDADLRFYITTVQDGWRSSAFLHYNCARRMTQICVFNTRLFSLHNTLNYAKHRACLRMVLLTDVYRKLTSLWINL